MAWGRRSTHKPATPPIGERLGPELLALIPDAVVVADESGLVMQANTLAEALFGMPLGRLVGSSIESLVPAEARARHAEYRRWFQEQPGKRPMGSGLDLWAQRPTGQRFPVDISLSPITVGERHFVLAAIRDLSAYRATLEALRSSEQRFGQLFADAPIAMAVIDPVTGTMLELNRRFVAMADRPEDALLGLAFAELVDDDDRTRVSAAVHELRGGSGPAAGFQCRIATPGGERWLRATVSLVDFAPATGRRLLLQAEDISGILVAEERLEHLVLHDELTKLPNRALALDRVSQALAASRRARTYVGVAFIDLDNFKVVNDSLGHEAGDELLAQVGARLSASVRAGDTVARFGGDEFVVCLPDLGPDAVLAEGEALAAIERIRDALKSPYRLDGGEVSYVDCSCGLALAVGFSHTAEALVRDADAAMYRSKEQGRSMTSVFDGALRARALERLSVEIRLRRAVEDHDLVLHYQPIVDLRDGAVVSAEALLRWHEPGVGTHTPAEFLAVAEDSGLIIPIGEWVVGQVCADFPILVERFGPSLETVALNVSVSQVQRSDFAAKFGAITVEAGTPADRLVVEITEQLALDFVHSVTRQLHELADMGVKLTLDDFGTRYGSLSYLRRLPITGVKIDRSLVAGLLTSPEDRATAAAVTRLCRAIHVTTVAEGVETREQAQAAASLGSDLGQGFLYGHPGGL